MRKRHNEKPQVTLPALSATQVVALVDWLLEAAHELDLFYAAEIRSQKQASRNKMNGNNDDEGGRDNPF